MAQSATDEIVDEIHAVRLAHAASFDFDMVKIIEDLKSSEQAHTKDGWPLIKAQQTPASSSNKALQHARFSKRAARHPA